MGKKDRGLHPCIDYQGMNLIMVKNWYLLPLISSAFELLQEATIFTKLDLRNAYQPVCIREGDELKIAFNTPAGHYEYLVMTFGLTNAPAVFQDLVNDVLGDMVNTLVSVYLNHIVIFSRSVFEHIQHMRGFFSTSYTTSTRFDRSQWRLSSVCLHNQPAVCTRTSLLQDSAMVSRFSSYLPPSYCPHPLFHSAAFLAAIPV